jgi:acetoin utilization deacetylase AcuC-like enzyme
MGTNALKSDQVVHIRGCDGHKVFDSLTGCMQLFYTDHFVLPLPQGHRFPMAKYRLLRDRIARSPLHADDILLVPPAATFDQLILAHERDYVERVLQGQLTVKEIQRIGFPWSLQMVERSRRSSGATLAAARVAMQEGISINLAGGTHHAMRGAGEGYCVFNDAAVTIRVLMSEGVISRAVVIDCDVHQGNGTADIFINDPGVVTFSIHSAKNFPSRKCPSVVDVELNDGMEDTEYLENLDDGLRRTMELGPFDLAVYLAGADPYEHDRLGRLKITKSGLRQRDQLVIGCLMSQRQIPVAVAMAGGYAPNVEDIVDIHAETVAVAKEAWLRKNEISKR